MKWGFHLAGVKYSQYNTLSWTPRKLTMQICYSCPFLLVENTVIPKQDNTYEKKTLAFCRKSILDFSTLFSLTYLHCRDC